MGLVETVWMILLGLLRLAAPQRNDEQQQEGHVHHGIEGCTSNGRGGAVHRKPRPQTGPHDLSSQNRFAGIKLRCDQPLHDAPAHQYATQNGAEDAGLWRAQSLQAIKRQEHQVNQPKAGQIQWRPSSQRSREAKADDNGGGGFQRGDVGCNGHVWVSQRFGYGMRVKLWLRENNYLRGKCNPARLAL